MGYSKKLYNVLGVTSNMIPSEPDFANSQN